IWVYALAGLPIGRLVDSWSRKKLLAAGVLVWSSLTAVSGLATSFAMLLFSRLGVGMGEAVCAPAGTSWLGDLFPPAPRSPARATFMLAVPIGGALGFSFTGPFAQAHGWRWAMVVAAAPALLLVPVLLRLPEPVRGATESGQAAPARGSFLDLLRIP